MKKIIILIIILPFIALSQELKPTIGVTLVNFKLVNEYDVPYPNTEIKLIPIDNNLYSIITDSIGESSILLDQNNSFRIICKVGEAEYEFDNPLKLESRDDLFTLDINLQLELYSQIIELNDLHFESGKYDIQTIAKPELNKILEYLKINQSINIEVAGHTDNIGDDIDNQALSEKRSRSVKAYLVSRGISQNRIVCVGYGELHPIADNNVSSGRLKNRRTEIRILK